MRRRRLRIILGCSVSLAVLGFPALAHHQKQVSCEVYSYLDQAGVFTQTVDPERIPAQARERVRIERDCILAHDISHAGGLVQPLSGGRLGDGRRWVLWVAGAAVLVAAAAAFILFRRKRKSRPG